MPTFVAVFTAMLLLASCASTLEGLKTDYGRLVDRVSNDRGNDREDEAVSATSPGSDPAPPKYPVELVREIQQNLVLLGYDPGETDGHFGQQTEAAIQDYQLDRDLAIDGKPSVSLLRMMKTER